MLEAWRDAPVVTMTPGEVKKSHHHLDIILASGRLTADGSRFSTGDALRPRHDVAAVTRSLTPCRRARPRRGRRTRCRFR
jgi:hypothetical protein